MIRLQYLGCQKAFSALHWLIAARQNDPQALEILNEWTISKHSTHPIDILVQCLVLYWIDKRKASRHISLLDELYAGIDADGHAWLAAETAALLSRLNPKKHDDPQQAEAFFEKRGLVGIVDLFQPEIRWQQALNALMHLERPDIPAAKTGRSSRLAWLLHVDAHGDIWDLSPREQVKSPGGGWSKGRRIALKRLYHEIGSFAYLTDQDKRICAAIEEERYRYRGYENVDYDFSPRALIALAGHPLVFAAKDPGVQLEIVKERPELLISGLKNGGFKVAFAQELDGHQEVQIIRESPTRIKIIETDDAVLNIARIVGEALTLMRTDPPLLT